MHSTARGAATEKAAKRAGLIFHSDRGSQCASQLKKPFGGRSGSPSQQARPVNPEAWLLQMQSQAWPIRKQEEARLSF